MVKCIRTDWTIQSTLDQSKFEQNPDLVPVRLTDLTCQINFDILDKL